MTRGQAKRVIRTRFRKNITSYHYENLESSGVTQHLKDTGHTYYIKTNNLKLVKGVNL